MKKLCAILALALACVLSISAPAQTVTPNAGLQVPSYQQPNWQVFFNYDLTRLDNIFGGTVAVPSITISGSITNANQAATKAYVDATAAGFLQASGATMTGPLILAADPTAPLQAATKEYVDAHAGSGGMLFPNPGISVSTGSAWGTSVAAPNGAIVGTTDTQALTNKTLDGISPTIMGFLANVTSDIQGQFNLLAPLASPAFAGTPSAPTASLSVNNTQIATTAFVQGLVSQATSNVLSSTGAAMNTGATLTLGDGSPAASQAFVATAISGLSGGGGTGTTQQYLYNQVTTASSSGWDKICYVGSSQCSGGVGTLAPATAPTESLGLNTPSAGTGTSNAVGHFQLQVPTAGGSLYTQALYIHSNSGSAADAATYYTRDFNEKLVQPAGKVNLEFDYWPVVSGWLYMFGTQCAQADGSVIDFDNQGNGWVKTTLSCASLLDGNYHHVHITYHRDPTSSTACSGAPCEYWDTIQFDGGTVYNFQDYNGGNVAKLPATTTSWGDGTGSQWQIDGKPTTASSGSPAIYDLYVDTDTVTASVTVAGSGSGSQTVTETKGNLGEYDFDGTNPTSGLTATGTPTADSTTDSTSPNAMLFNAASEYFLAPLGASESTLYGRFLINISTSQTSNARLFEIDGGTGNTQLGNLFIQGSNGYLTFSDSANTTSYSCASAALTTGAWHRIELAWTEGATTGSIQVLIDGTQTCNVTNINTGTTPATYVRFGEAGTGTPAWTYDIDNVGISSTGLLGAVTVTTQSGSTPLYDLYGSAASVASTSLQDSNNLSDLTNPTAALAYLLANPGAGSYIVTCSSATSCSPVAVLHGAGTPIGSASTIAPVAEVTHVTGTNAISTILVPYAGYAGCIRLVADGAWSTMSGGNVATSMTASAGTLYSACFDGTSWYIH